MINELLKFNKEFVKNKEYEEFITEKYPDKKLAILTCMDTRLTKLLPAALGIKNGDVKLIKTAGPVISTEFGSTMRSLIVSVYSLGVEEIVVIGHYDCGMQSLNCKEVLDKMKSRGISQESIDNCDVDFETWLNGFSCVQESVKQTVKDIKDHPLIPKDIKVFGLIMDPVTGQVDRV